MSFQVSQLNIRPENIFSFSEALLSPVTSLLQVASSAIHSIGSLFSQSSVFTQAQEEEIRRIHESLRLSPQEEHLQSLTKKNTKDNQKALKEPSAATAKERSPRRICFSDTPVEWAFRKDKPPSPQPLQPLPQHQTIRPILKRRLMLDEVD